MANERVNKPDEMETCYGFSKVDVGEKQPRVNSVFHRVAERYDVMNDLMSAGLHRVWKNALVSKLSPPKSPGKDWRFLDVAGGTGDVAFRIVEASNSTVTGTVLDINGSMLAVGQERAAKKGFAPHLDFIEANAEELPFEDHSFDAYTIAFGIRNVPRIQVALNEAFRVLKPGGRFLCLEFSEVDIALLDRFYEQWSMQAIPRIGKVVTGDGEPYQYLVESIRKFPNQEKFADMVRSAGFAQVSYTNYTGGIAAIHSGWKL